MIETVKLEEIPSSSLMEYLKKIPKEQLVRDRKQELMEYAARQTLAPVYPPNIIVKCSAGDKVSLPVTISELYAAV